MATTEKGSTTVSEEWEKSKIKFTNKSASEYHDPCQDFANRSIKCMHRNGGDKSMCSDYFQAYRDCKKAWMAEKKFGRRS